MISERELKRYKTEAESLKSEYDKALGTLEQLIVQEEAKIAEIRKFGIEPEACEAYLEQLSRDADAVLKELREALPEVVN